MVSGWGITKTEVRNEIEIFITLPKYNIWQRREEGNHYQWWSLTYYIFSICRTSHQSYESVTRAFQSGSWHTRWLQKCFGTRRHCPQKGRLGCQAINLVPPRRVRAQGNTRFCGLRRINCVTWIIGFPSTLVMQPRPSEAPQPKAVSMISVAVSHQTGLDTRSITRRPIIQRQLAYFHHRHYSIQCICEEWNIPINVRR